MWEAPKHERDVIGRTVFVGARLPPKGRSKDDSLLLLGGCKLALAK